MKIVFGIMFLGSLGTAMYYKYKLNKAYECICYLDSKSRKGNQKNRALLVKLKDLVDSYKHGGNIFEVMRDVSDTIIKIELDTDQSTNSI